ncbi:hypothetical protein H5411_30485 [Amycolatopsis echigonensis]|uniref:Acetyltransferase (GNAT) family protein n=1 Tax=Amycolatopsis echigonensis TaxID=2576905 RepID=A0A8E1W3V0_9PSEU|nr:hypothetical protein [Amycolatopsis echigonensis]
MAFTVRPGVAGDADVLLGFFDDAVESRLLEYSMDEAKRRGIDLVRVDCWAGGDGDLPRYYESQGFKPTEQFTVDGWLGQVLEQRVGG